MKKETEVRLELFAENVRAVKKGIATTTGMDRRTAALIYAVRGKTIDRDVITNTYNMLKKGTSVLSPFRETTPLCTAAMLSLEADPKAALDRALEVYGMLKEVKFRNSAFLAEAALQIATGTQPDKYKQTVMRMRSFYDLMKANSWLHAAADDYILAALFALSGLDEKTASERIEKVFQKLRSEFSGKGSVLALAQVMALVGKTDEMATGRVVALRDVLKRRRMSLAKPFIVPIIGTLSQLDLSVDTIVQEVRDVEIFLKAQTLSLTKTEIHMAASAMVVATYAKENTLVTASAATAAGSMILAAQTSFIITVAASAAVVATMK